MMKRFELSRFSPLEVSRRVQQCLRFEGVNTNGVAATNGIGVAAAEREPMSSDPPILGSPCCSDGPNKTNLLSTIKKKLKKSKRNKRCDGGRTRSDPNVCQCHSENCELKHYRTRKLKQGDKCWPISSSILRSQNHLPDPKTDDVAELIPCVADDPEPCSCFGRQPQSSSNLASYSLSNVSCDVSPSLTERVQTQDGPNFVSPEEGRRELILGRDHTDRRDSAELLDDVVISPEDATMQISLYGTTLYDSTAIDPCVPRVGNLTQELYKLSKYGWYWGPINRSEAEEKLVDQPDGAFLVRDSSDDRYILSLSFRSYGKTLHTRIEHSNGLFSFYSQPEPEGHSSIVELIQQSMCYSQSGVFCYSRSRSPGSPSFPVRLTKPISRFTQVRSLQYLCRFVIRQFTRYDHIQKLPLPPRIKGYLEEGHY